MFKITGILIVIIITSGAGWFIYNDINKGNSSENDVDDNLIAASVDNIPQDIKDIVIENDKQKTDVYIPLHELYKYSYKQNTTLVTDVLFEGLKEEPRNINLLITLAAYFKEIEDIVNAKKYYTQARDEAQKLKNTQLTELLNKEI